MARLVLLAVLALTACSTQNRDRYREFTPVAEGLLAAYTAGDSLALDTLVAAPEVREWLKAVSTREPQLIRSAAGRLRATNGSLEGDSAYVTYSFNYRGGRERLAFEFIRQGGRLQVRTIGLPDRI